ncbi:MAG: hypothetical protein ABIK43_05110, partial [candidate division WOR-3 bacterium]
LVMSIPFYGVIAALQFKVDSGGSRLKALVDAYPIPVAVVVYALAAAGTLLFCYILNLRMDTALYARVINGIRKYFYDRSDLEVAVQLRTRVLPGSFALPHYFETSYFLPVVAVFALVNTLYAYGATFAVTHYSWMQSLWALLLGLLHFVAYWSYTQYREHLYLRSNILGVDIDGVLTQHREHFCQLLTAKGGPALEPEKITCIPVHEHPTMGVTREQEHAVFNDPQYWTGLDVVPDSAETLSRIRRSFAVRIWLFTHREWPVGKTRAEVALRKKEFLKACKAVSLRDWWLQRLLPAQTRPLQQITREWLKAKRFVSYKLVFDRGNDYSADPRTRFHNRFYVARKKKIRFFVEDDIEKAVKLSFICEVVFLLSHPYNQPAEDLPEEFQRFRSELPANVVRVESWEDIYRAIRKYV